jgi:hypothetical protein
MATFECKVCGKTYEGVPATAPEFTAEDVETRRQAWLAADEKLTKSPDNEHFEKAHQKAWLAYMATQSTGVERVPDALVTGKSPERVSYVIDLVDKDGPGKVLVERNMTALFLQCAEHVPVKAETKEAP